MAEIKKNFFYKFKADVFVKFFFRSELLQIMYGLIILAFLSESGSFLKAIISFHITLTKLIISPIK